MRSSMSSDRSRTSARIRAARHGGFRVGASRRSTARGGTRRRRGRARRGSGATLRRCEGSRAPRKRGDVRVAPRAAGRRVRTWAARSSSETGLSSSSVAERARSRRTLDLEARLHTSHCGRQTGCWQRAEGGTRYLRRSRWSRREPGGMSESQNRAVVVAHDVTPPLRRGRHGRRRAAGRLGRVAPAKGDGGAWARRARASRR